MEKKTTSEETMVAEEEALAASSPTKWHPWNWPAPVPRLWAYSRLLQNKIAAKLTEQGTPPERLNEELPLFSRYYHHFWSNDPDPIVERLLFVGSAKNAADSASLERNGIRLVVNATKGLQNFFEGRNPDRLTYTRVPLEDCQESSIEDAREAFDVAIAAIAKAVEAQRPVLVHCFAGASRSVALVCAYLCKHRGMAPEAAYALVRSKRACAALNQNFMAWLQENYAQKI